MPITYVLGNGLSIAYKPDYYSLPALTTAVRTALAGRMIGARSLLELTDSIVDRMSPIPPGVPRSFEEYAGPVERLASAVEQLVELALITDDAALAQGITLTAQRTRDLYVRVVATVLDIVTQHINSMGDDTPIRTVAEHLIQATKDNEGAHVFTLNYDALLDSALLHFYHDDRGRPRADAGFTLVDDAQGNLPDVIHLNGADVSVLGWRRDPYGGPTTLRLHHLHGAATWIRHHDTGDVFKARHLQDLRDVQLWERWAQGREPHIEPVVVLGDRKDRLITRDPFDLQYAYLQAAVTQSSRVIIAGYGFGDEALNAAVRASIDGGKQICVVNPDPAVEARARNALGLTGARGGQLVFVPQGLPEGLDAT